MPFIPVANGVEIVLEFTSPDGAPKVIFGVALPIPGTLASLGVVAEQILNYLFLSPNLPWSDDTSVTGIHANALDTSSSPTFEDHPGSSTWPGPLNGSIASPSVTSGVAEVVTLQTGLRGRSYRGRNYWPAVPQNRLSGHSDVLASYVVEWNTFINGLIADLEATSTPLVVISRHTGGAPRVAGIKTPVLAARAETKLGTQRRRIAGTFGG